MSISQERKERNEKKRRNKQTNKQTNKQITNSEKWRRTNKQKIRLLLQPFFTLFLLLQLLFSFLFFVNNILISSSPLNHIHIFLLSPPPHTHTHTLGLI
mmetsp:Transcript_40315/g.51917  ORF Transcript_40315/g.51917 Transcript_40315/m.51917 type:complete len:99 (+) Transcript_40315:470-766(+)